VFKSLGFYVFKFGKTHNQPFLGVF
jgi:hypothetical protein